MSGYFCKTRYKHLLILLLRLFWFRHSAVSANEVSAPLLCLEEVEVDPRCESNDPLGTEIRFKMLKPHYGQGNSVKWLPVSPAEGGDLQARRTPSGETFVSLPMICCGESRRLATLDTRWGLEVTATCGKFNCTQRFYSSPESKAAYDSTEVHGFSLPWIDCNMHGPLVISIKSCGRLAVMMEERFDKVWYNAVDKDKRRRQPNCRALRYQHWEQEVAVKTSSFMHVECENQELPRDVMVHLDESDRPRPVDHNATMYCRSFVNFKTIGNTCYESNQFSPRDGMDERGLARTPDRLEWYFHAEAYCGEHHCSRDICIPYERDCERDSTHSFCKLPERLLFRASDCGPLAVRNWESQKAALEAKRQSGVKERCSSALYNYGVVSVQVKCSTAGERCGCLKSAFCGEEVKDYHSVERCLELAKHPRCFTRVYRQWYTKNLAFDECNKNSQHRLCEDGTDEEYYPCDPLVNVQTAHEHDCVKFGEPYPWTMIAPGVDYYYFRIHRYPADGVLKTTESFYAEAGPGTYVQVLRQVQDRNVGENKCAKVQMNVVDYDFESDERQSHLGNFRDCKDTGCTKAETTQMTKQNWHTLKLPLPGERITGTKGSLETVEVGKPFFVEQIVPARVKCESNIESNLPMQVVVKYVVLYEDVKFSEDRNQFLGQQRRSSSRDSHLCRYNFTDDLSKWPKRGQSSASTSSLKLLLDFLKDNVRYHTYSTYPTEIKHVDILPHRLVYYRKEDESQDVYKERVQKEEKYDNQQCFPDAIP